MDAVEKERRIKEADEIIRWAILYLEGTIKCKVTDFKKHDFRVQFFSSGDKLIMLTLIPEDWINGTQPNENVVHDQLELLCKNLERI